MLLTLRDEDFIQYGMFGKDMCKVMAGVGIIIISMGIYMYMLLDDFWFDLTLFIHNLTWYAQLQRDKKYK